MMNNTVYGDNYGNVGGNNNTAINYFILGNASFIERVNTEARLSEKQWGLIFLDVTNSCSDTIISQIEQGMKQKDYLHNNQHHKPVNTTNLKKTIPL